MSDEIRAVELAKWMCEQWDINHGDDETFKQAVERIAYTLIKNPPDILAALAEQPSVGDVADLIYDALADDKTTHRRCIDVARALLAKYTMTPKPE